ncbi:MAG: CocE/NonD family hydrolase [Roseibium sp.]|uniref:CocE/NonD family hydrolase n=1 Tax=Roseibium sp. TaxID=1936156 RepID=UPI00260FFD59|nr:CocE/NonD family hydrolase [Roseibium sp.]MCV0426229.1 CocE/NonD family hydrolase [Roseibium sp.]
MLNGRNSESIANQTVAADDMPGVESRSEMIAMRDGVRLATDIFLPDSKGQFPTILYRTPYGRNQARKEEITESDDRPMAPRDLARYYCSNGYAVVFQDCRGRHDSEGEFEKYLSDGTDGFDVCEWLNHQSWSNGQICTMGLSYDAHLQAILGSQNPPGLVAQILDCGGQWNSWKAGTRYFGVFELKQVMWAMRQAVSSPEARSNPVMSSALENESIEGWFTSFPWKRGHSPLRHVPRYEDALFDQWEHGPFGPYWQMLGAWTEGWHHNYSHASCVHVAGWYDPYALNAVGNYQGLKAAGRTSQRLVLGPFTHGFRSRTWSGDVDFGPDAPIDSWAGDWLAYRLKIFDEATKGTLSDEPEIRLFIMGGGSGCKTKSGRMDHGGRWIAAESWPLPGTRPTEFFLHQCGSLNVAKPQSAPSSISYNFDPSRPVPTIGGNVASLEPFVEAGGYDQTEADFVFGASEPYLPLAARPDVLVFQTEPLDKAIEVAGEITVELTVSTDGPDTDFTAKLLDVYPPNTDYPKGYALNLSDGVVKLRYVDDETTETFRKPGEIVRAKITLPPIANKFAKGHRIRLDVASSNFPKYEVNSNTGEPEGKARCKRIAINTVYLDERRASKIILPLLG